MLTESITIRNARDDEADALVSLGIRTFRDTFDEMNTAENMMMYITGTFNVKRIKAELKEPESIFFVAELDDELVGYARMRNRECDENKDMQRPVEIERLYVDKNYIGQRVGYLLMKTCLEYAEAQGYETVWLGVWENNFRAINFYKQWGFAEYGSHIFMLGNDAQTDLLMKKKI